MIAVDLTKDIINKLKHVDKTKQYKELLEINSVRQTPTREELEVLYRDNRISIKSIYTLYCWLDAAKVSKLLRDYDFELWHLEKGFKPPCHQTFINEILTQSLNSLCKKYNTSHVALMKYITQHNLDHKGYFKEISSISTDQIASDLSKDIIYNVADKYNTTVVEIKRKMQYAGVDISNIDISDADCFSSLKRFVERNPSFEGKTITHDERLHAYVMNKTADHYVYTTKISERVYRIIKGFKPHDIVGCTYCNKPVRFYTYEKGYGNEDIKLCKKCIPSHLTYGTSAVSQELFGELMTRCDFLNDQNTNYSNLNYEFAINIPKHLIAENTNKYYYAIDFKYDNKLIEYDGEYWHDQDRDDAKDNLVNTLGYEIIHIKHTDYIKDPESQIKKCLKFLTS